MASRLRQFLTSRTGLIILLLVLVPVLHYMRILRPLENVIIRIFQPAQTALYKTTSTAVDTRVEREEYQNQSPDQLVERIHKLENQLDELTVENAYWQTLVQETTLLQSQVDFLKEQSYHAVTARVSSRSTDAISQSIILNKGSADGIHTGMPVIIDEGVLIGTVESATDYSSSVLLTTSFDSRISASVQNKQQSAGIVRGSHNIALLMEFIPQFDEIANGDVVLTNGTDEQIPSGLVMGRIEEVHNQADSLFQDAALNPLYRASEISVVSVITQ